MRITILTMLMVLSACTGAGSDGTAAPQTTMPHEGAPTTVDGSASPPSTSPSLVDGGLVPIDPSTLVPDTNSEPFVVGAFHEGVVSPNGRWAAVKTWSHAGETNTISLIDLESETVVASVDEYAESPTVTDDGVAHYFSEVKGLSITRLDADGAGTIEARLPSELGPLTDSLADLGGGSLGYLGTPTEIGPVSLVLIDGDETRTIVIDDVTGGSEEMTSETGLAVVRNVHPAVVWDRPNHRALVVDAEHDRVISVDLDTGRTSTHDWSVMTGWFDNLRFGMATARAKGISVGATRDAHVTNDGRYLYVATETDELTGGTGDWTARSSAGSLLRIDTNTWEAVTIEAEVWRLFPSPDDSYLLGMGAVIESDSRGESVVEPSPVYVIDMATGDLLNEFETTSGIIASAQWSPEPNVFYMISSGTQANIDIVDLTFDQIVGSVGFREMSLVGEAGLISFHLDQG